MKQNEQREIGRNGVINIYELAKTDKENVREERRNATNVTTHCEEEGTDNNITKLGTVRKEFKESKAAR